jgi:hypothetical protein
MTVAGRVLPRRLAPILLGGGNIGSGITGLMSLQDHVASLQFAGEFMPLRWWWWSFIALGAVILTGLFSTRFAFTAAVIAFGWWLFFVDFVWRAHTHLITAEGQHLVSIRGVWDIAWLAALHLLLTPYLRRPTAT